MFLFKKINGFFLMIIIALFVFCIISCDSQKENATINSVQLNLENIFFDGFIIDSTKIEKNTIYLSSKKSMDSLVFTSIDEMIIPFGGTSAFVSLDENIEDPEPNWNIEIKNGSQIQIKDKDSILIVVLDNKNCVVVVWNIILLKKDFSSSSEKLLSSKKQDSSSSEKKYSSSEILTSSSKNMSSSRNLSSSSCEQKNSSNEILTSSSKNMSSSETLSSSSSEKLLSSKKQDSSSSEKKYSSSEISSSSEQNLSSSKKLRSDKEITSLQIWVSGVKFSEIEKIDSKKRILVSLKTINSIDSIQMYRLNLSEGALADIPLKSNLNFIKVSEYTYEYEFTINAEDGSKDKWIVEAIIPKGVYLKDFCIKNDDAQITINGNKIYIEVPYGTDLTKIRVMPMDTISNLVYPIEMKFVGDDEELHTYYVVAGMQLLGTDFSSRENDFWATTSDAMDKSQTSALITISSEKNLEIENNSLVLTSKIVTGKDGLIGITAAYKLAGGFYFTGSYIGNTALEIYEQGYSSGTPSTKDSDISKDMKFGKPFMGRPISFTLSYSYEHIANTNIDYPQKSLIYVMLLSEDSTIVASGVLSDSQSIQDKTIEVPLIYGEDLGLLNASYPIMPNLKSADKTKEVSYICVMFASSAYAHVVSGGAITDYEKNYRGGENSKLILNSFRLNY